jgi:hypothetical protein
LFYQAGAGKIPDRKFFSVLLFLIFLSEFFLRLCQTLYEPVHIHRSLMVPLVLVGRGYPEFIQYRVSPYLVNHGKSRLAKKNRSIRIAWPIKKFQS